MQTTVPYRGQALTLQIGDAVLYRNDFIAREPMTYLSYAVRGFTGRPPLWRPCPVNHTAIVSVNEQGEWVLIEALGRGLVSRPLKQHLDRADSRIVVKRDLRGFDAEDFVLRLRAKVGVKYDLRNLLLEQPPYRISLLWAAGVHKLSGGLLSPEPVWIGRRDSAAATRLQCAEAYAWARREQEYWLYSTAEILTHPAHGTAYSELRGEDYHPVWAAGLTLDKSFNQPKKQ